MRDELDLAGGRNENSTPWIAVAGAVAGAAAIYFLSTERGRAWLRELPEAGRRCATSVREAMSLLREISEQVEQSVAAFEQALDRVGDTIAAREHAGARNGGEHAHSA